MSPADIVFGSNGRCIKDFIPILHGRYRPHRVWRETAVYREEALRKRHALEVSRLAEHTRKLPPLVVGDMVRIQNQMGIKPRRWDKTGKVIEVRQFDQYAIRLDGSGRVTPARAPLIRRLTSPVHLVPTASKGAYPLDLHHLPHKRCHRLILRCHHILLHTEDHS